MPAPDRVTVFIDATTDFEIVELPRDVALTLRIGETLEFCAERTGFMACREEIASIKKTFQERPNDEGEGVVFDLSRIELTTV